MFLFYLLYTAPCKGIDLNCLIIGIKSLLFFIAMSISPSTFALPAVFAYKGDRNMFSFTF